MQIQSIWMKYFEPIVPATVMLMEPVVGALLGVAAGTAPFPGIQTWFGDLVVAAGGWFCSTFALSRLIPRKAQAQAMVEERIKEDKKSK